MTKKTERSG